MSATVRLHSPILPIAKRGRFPVSDKSGRTVNGIVFDSKKESRRYTELLLLQKARKISSLHIQIPFRVPINGKHFCTFTVDFVYGDERTGKIVYEEVKSSGTAKDAAYRLRRKAAELYHDLEVTEIIL